MSQGPHKAILVNQTTGEVRCEYCGAVPPITGVCPSNVLPLQPQGAARRTDCTALKNALLNPILEGNFFCLPNEVSFPVSVKDEPTLNKIPSKLLKREFHREIQLILQHLGLSGREGHDEGVSRPNNRGAVFFGPSGIGKSWAAMAVLMDELRLAEKTGRTVVYFDSVGSSAYVFGKHTCVHMAVKGGPNAVDIPELLESDTLLIYDAMEGSKDVLRIFRCDYLIFSSPNAGNYKHVARCGLLRFICPSWTVDELKQLGKGYGDRLPSSEVERRFGRFGGSPRFVISLDTNWSDERKKDAKMLLRGDLSLWSESAAFSPDWPSSLLKAKYNTEEIATTPQQAYKKYSENNVEWEFASATAFELVLREYEKMLDNEKRAFEEWLKDEPKAPAALHGHVFENKIVKLMSSQVEEVEIKALEDNRGSNGEQLGRVTHSKHWTFTPFQVIQHPTLTKVGNSCEMAQLEELTDPSVLYRLPPGFPVIDYFNPPNNCFSVNVGKKHLIDLGHAEKLCEVVALNKQVNFVHVSPSSAYAAMKYGQSFKLPDGTKPKQSVLHKLPAQTIQGISRIVQFCLRFKSW